DAYAVMTKDELAILTLLPTLRPGKRTFPYIKPCIQTGYAELDFTHFMLSDICDFRLEEYVGSGKLTARLGRDETPTDAPEGPDMPPRWNRRSGPGGLFGSGGKESVSTVPLSSIAKEPNKGIDRICLFNFTFRKKAVVQQFLEILKVVAKTGELPAESGTKKETVCPKCKTPYPDPHSPVCPRCMDKMQMVKRLLPFFYKYKFFIILIFLCILASSVLELLSPYISSKIFYDEVLAVNGKYYGQIVGIILVIVGANLLSTVVSMITQLINSRISARVTYDLKKIIFSSFGRLSLSFFTGRQTGGLMTQLNSDANTLYWFFCDAFPYMIINIIQIIGVSAVLLYMDWKLTLLTVLPLPLLLYVYRLILYAFKKMHARQFSKSRSFYDLIADVLSGIRIVKSFSKEKEEVS
ncbi:MAG TPA: hypothetical protein DCY74_01670, partial [Clostridiales bacterium]|nr:hypothetical protein [Clostridiales bacterium]